MAGASQSAGGLVRPSGPVYSLQFAVSDTGGLWASYLHLRSHISDSNLIQDPGQKNELNDEQKKCLAIGLAQLQAVSAFLHSLPELILRRREIQQTRKLSDHEVYSENRLTLDFSDMIDFSRRC